MIKTLLKQINNVTYEAVIACGYSFCDLQNTAKGNEIRQMFN